MKMKVLTNIDDIEIQKDLGKGRYLVTTGYMYIINKYMTNQAIVKKTVVNGEEIYILEKMITKGKNTDKKK